MAISYEFDGVDGVTHTKSMSQLRTLDENDLQGSFYLHITHGHVIRSAVHVLRDMLNYAILELTPTSLRILRLDKTEHIIVNLVLDTTKFFQYYFNSKKNVIRVGVNLAVLWSRMKIIGKHDPFILMKNDGADFMILDFGSQARHQYKLQGVCEQEIEIPTYESVISNIRITVREITKAMASIRQERWKVRIKGYRDRLIVETVNAQTVQRLGSSIEDIWRKIDITPDSLVSDLRSDNPPTCTFHLDEDADDKTTGEGCLKEFRPFYQYPKYSVTDVEPVVDIVQSNLLLKSLSKLYTLSPNSWIATTVEKDKPIKMCIPIGEYGHLIIYLLSGNYSAISEDAETVEEKVKQKKPSGKHVRISQNVSSPKAATQPVKPADVDEIIEDKIDDEEEQDEELTSEDE